MKHNIGRLIIRRLIVCTFILLICPTAIYAYSKDIEPKSLDINYFDIKTSNVSKGMEGLKIVQFSDTLIGEHFSLEQLQNLVIKINKQKPDIIVFTGDLIDNSAKFKSTTSISPILKQLKATYGKYAIYGNHDVGGRGRWIYSNILSKSGFKILDNTSKTITLKDHSKLSIVGLDDYLLGRPNPNKAFSNVPLNTFTLLLVHEPDVSDRLYEYPIDLQLSGHSHGGQVKMPFIGTLYTPPLAEKHTEGFYKIKNKFKPMILYVNRGIGTTRLPFRFLSKPELTVFTLKRPSNKT